MMRSQSPRRITVGGATAVGALFFGFGSMASAAVDEPPPPDAQAVCADLEGFVYADTEITDVELVPSGELGGVGEHCLVTGKMQERVSEVDGDTYAIGFEMRLPEEWNGRFLYQGNGGLDGSVAPAVGSPASGDSALADGFAVISSDAGHSGSQNPLFGIDPQARLDYGYQAVGTLTPMAKELITARYGDGPDFSYIAGGSNGGRHVMVAASRHADMFDGFYAVAPGFNLPQAAVAQIWGAQQYATVASEPGDLGTALTAQERRVVADAIIEVCDALDGLEDGMVLDSASCQTHFSIFEDVPTCDGERDGTCLSPEQQEVLDNIFSGARTTGGDPIYSSFPFDPGLDQEGWVFWEFGASVALDPVAYAFTFQTPPETPAIFSDLLGFALSLDIDGAADSIYSSNEPYSESAMEFMTPPDPTNLDALAENGKKMIVAHGLADAVFSSDDTARWFEAVQQRYGDAQEVVRYFEVPGMGHVSGGPATDTFGGLSALVAWVEQGQVPEQLTGHVSPGNPEVPDDWAPTRSRPVCAYPQVAVYVDGDPEDASSFQCALNEVDGEEPEEPQEPEEPEEPGEPEEPDPGANGDGGPGEPTDPSPDPTDEEDSHLPGDGSATPDKDMAVTGVSSHGLIWAAGLLLVAGAVLTAARLRQRRL